MGSQPIHIFVAAANRGDCWEYHSQLNMRIHGDGGSLTKIFRPCLREDISCHSNIDHLYLNCSLTQTWDNYPKCKRHDLLWIY